MKKNRSKLNHFAVRQKLTQHCKSTVFRFFKKRLGSSLVVQWLGRRVLDSVLIKELGSTMLQGN